MGEVEEMLGRILERISEKDEDREDGMWKLSITGCTGVKTKEIRALCILHGGVTKCAKCFVHSFK